MWLQCPHKSSVAWEKQGRVSELGVGGRREVADRIRRDLVVDMWADQKTKVRPWVFSNKCLWTEAKAQSSGMNEMARP